MSGAAGVRGVSGVRGASGVWGVAGLQGAARLWELAWLVGISHFHPCRCLPSLAVTV